ncbi:DUF2238 domain-containing protein [Holophaga foetida]|uniref:DUF2238 domain-containing protein n=1 Tax=Holophaga foetida TaxID=35839 RepID=UPI0002473B5D|nr:DUF2238 domain-containing protein [Holophaga foetida]
MFTTARHARFTPFRENRFLKILVTLYALMWLAMAYKPLYPSGWLLENWLVFALVGLLFLSYWRFPLSDLSYLLLAVFLSLHAVGAHYTYSNVPFGFWLRDHFHLARNPFDRIVHFSFGLLLAYPARELFMRVARTRGFWNYYLPLDMVLALSAIYEIIEALTAHSAAPHLGDAFLGTQGDIWDAQKDMAMAATGAVVAMAVTFIVRRWISPPETD